MKGVRLCISKENWQSAHNKTIQQAGDAPHVSFPSDTFVTILYQKCDTHENAH